jgi:hypothetical protein
MTGFQMCSDGVWLDFFGIRVLSSLMFSFNPIYPMVINCAALSSYIRSC